MSSFRYEVTVVHQSGKVDKYRYPLKRMACNKAKEECRRGKWHCEVFDTVTGVDTYFDWDAENSCVERTEM